MKRRVHLGLILTLAVPVALLAAPAPKKEPPKPKTVATVDGEPIYQVLPLGAIPAIENPVFVTGEEAAAQMRPEEPVLGVVLGGEAHAYSLWQLDAHEIVNDTISGTAIAATW